MADGDLAFIPTDPEAEHPLGRSVVWHDPRNRQHRALVLGDVLPDRNRQWFSPDVFDQQGASCTVQSATGVLRTGPFRKAFVPHWPAYDTEEERHAAYLVVQTFDPWEGGEPTYEGSSTDAPFQMFRSLGVIPSWKWLFGLDEVKQWVMHYGPLSVGTNWYKSMFTPDADNYLQVDDTQGSAGGHAWRVVGYSIHRRSFRMVNSWSKNWGVAGRAWVQEETMGRLLAEQGEAVTVGA